MNIPVHRSKFNQKGKNFSTPDEILMKLHMHHHTMVIYTQYNFHEIPFSANHMGIDTRNPVCGVSYTVRFKPACSATETSWKIYLVESLLSDRWAGWSAPLLFANTRSQILSRRCPYYGLIYSVMKFDHFLGPAAIMLFSSPLILHAIVSTGFLIKFPTLSHRTMKHCTRLP